MPAGDARAILVCKSFMENLPDRKQESFFNEILKFGLIAVLVVLPIRLFIAQPFVVNGASMEPTFENGDYLIIDELSYHVGDPKRGDVVVFRYPKDPSKFFIKRVIGLPGETVVIRDGAVFITRDGQTFKLEEAYVAHVEGGSATDKKLGMQEYFVMGDNRPASSDSRSWGALPRENVIGTPILRLFPLSYFAISPGAADDIVQ